jgi:hypothetical protein
VHEDEAPPRNLRERTGRHFCIRCLAETPAEEWFANDHVCDACAEALEGEAEKGERGNDE